MNKQVQLSVFQFQEAFDVRVILINDDPWFIASDLAKVLEYTHVPHMVRMCDDDEKGVQIVDTLGGQQKTTVISEPGLYRIMAASRSERAKPFQRWLFHTVLPTIRRTGSYTLPVPQAPSTQPTQDLRWQIPDIIHELVSQGVSAKGTLYNRLYRRFNVNSYKDIPADQSQAAIDYLKRMAQPHTKKASLTINDGEHYFVVKDGVVIWEKVLKPHCNDIPSNALKDPQLMLEHIRQVVGEFVGKQALPVPRLEMPKPTYIPQHQAQEIRTRMDRLIGLFHPFSPQFSDALGVIRVLRGYSADTGTVNKTYLALIPPLA